MRNQTPNSPLYPAQRERPSLVAEIIDARSASRLFNPLTETSEQGRILIVSTLAEIEEAAERLKPEEKQALMLFLAARLRAAGARVPEPRKYSREQIESWLEEDEAGCAAPRAVTSGST